MIGRVENSVDRRCCATVSLVVGLTAVCLLIGTGLGTGSPHGAGDNGDGVRMYCGAGVVPTTPDGQANWKGVVVDTFRAGETPCAQPLPSSALIPMEVTARLAGPTWNLRTLGWSWTGVLLAGLAVAAAAAGAARPWRALVVLPVVLPLASPVFSRFFLSTYAEPAGLAGTALALAGMAAMVASPPRGAARWTAVAVLLAGGVLAATAKPAYTVVLIPVVLAFVAGTPVRSRTLRLLLAAAFVLGTGVPVAATLAVQEHEYGPVNTHNLVFTAVGPESGGDALEYLGLPASTSRALGSAYYPDGGASIPDWRAVVGARWPQLRDGALEYVATHPGTAIRMIDGAMRATSDPTVGYLPTDLRSEAGSRPVPPPDPPSPEQGAARATLEPWLRNRPLGLLPWALLAVAVVVGATSSTRRRADSSGQALAVLAVTAAGTMALLAVAAVLGDGFFEIAKHTWLAAYTGVVGMIAVLGTAAVRLAHAFGTSALAVDRERRDAADGASENHERQEAATTAGSRR